jgi:hypothetical protein
MNFDLLLLGAFLAFSSLFTVVFLLQRFQYRRKKAANPHYRGFYPTAAALALSLLSLQTIAQPDLNHSIEQRLTEAEDEDDNGDPDDPFAQLNRQFKQIRNGESGECIGPLKIPLRKRS